MSVAWISCNATRLPGPHLEVGNTRPSWNFSPQPSCPICLSRDKTSPCCTTQITSFTISLANEAAALRGGKKTGHHTLPAKTPPKKQALAFTHHLSRVFIAQMPPERSSPQAEQSISTQWENSVNKQSCFFPNFSCHIEPWQASSLPLTSPFSGSTRPPAAGTFKGGRER